MTVKQIEDAEDHYNDFPHYPDESEAPAPPQKEHCDQYDPENEFVSIADLKHVMNQNSLRLYAAGNSVCEIHRILIEEGLIRSRPAPSPQPTEEGTEYTQPFADWLQHHDATIRNATLDALKKDLESRFISSTNRWSKGRNSGLLECCNIIDEHRSTRPQEPKP